MTHPPLFVYGTLQDADVLAAVLGRDVDMAALRRASAPGYRAVTHPGRVYPALAVQAGDAAPGLLLEAISPLDRAVLDAFEGDEYHRRPIEVLVDGSSLVAEAYLPADHISPDLPAWSLVGWTIQHKPAVIGHETDTAAALRKRLSEQPPY